SRRVAFHSDRGRPHALYVSLLSVLATRPVRRAVHEIDDLGLAPLLAAGEELQNAQTSRPLQPIRKDLVIRFRRQRLAREAIMAAKEISVKKYVVRLSGEERERLETLIRKGKSPARRVLKARILLKADVSEAGKGWSDNRIIDALETSP